MALRNSSLLETLVYGPAPESDSTARAWIDQHERRFGLFINNQWVHPEGREYTDTCSPADNTSLAAICEGTAEDADVAVQAARTAFTSWSKTSGHERAKFLYAIARQMQKHQRLLAVVESMDNGKPIRESRDADTPLCVRHFYYHAGWAQLMDSELPQYRPVGVISQVIPWNFPLLMLAWKIAPAIAMGNTVVLKPAPSTRLSALLFAEIVLAAGLPPGVVNILPGGNDLGFALVNHPDVDKVAFTGSTGVGRLLRQSTAGSGKKLSLELGGKSPFVVFDSCDIDSAIEGVVDAIWYNQGQVCCAGSRCLVQENIYDRFMHKLRRRMNNLRIGGPLDKCVDIGAINSKRQLDTIAGYVEEARASGAEVIQSTAPLPEGDGFWFPPTVIANVQPTSKCVVEEIFGPVLTVLTFRHPKEAIALSNNTAYGLASSVWTQDISLALDVAFQIRAGVVWVNCHNMFDAAAGFGGYKESGYGRESGKEGLKEYLEFKWKGVVRRSFTDEQKAAPWGADTPPAIELPSAGSARGQSVDKTYKMYIGGKQSRPDGQYSRTIRSPSGAMVGEVGEGNRKDIRNAVEAAHKAAPGWGKRAAYNRSQILFYIAENLDARFEEFAKRIASMTGESIESARNVRVASSCHLHLDRKNYNALLLENSKRKSARGVRDCVVW
eukprot:TRINITY_DN2900_c0_g1_i2.p1 TRINITY_DN2900_c0_g1~~TRINITY_DN2900_c0_g1_i2.p1  ORF type:complete len:667 (+),score=209.93 TRINITY_DN2900_c0_g1_i2:118-2118(+)